MKGGFLLLRAPPADSQGQRSPAEGPAGWPGWPRARNNSLPQLQTTGLSGKGSARLRPAPSLATPNRRSSLARTDTELEGAAARSASRGGASLSVTVEPPQKLNERGVASRCCSATPPWHATPNRHHALALEGGRGRARGERGVASPSAPPPWLATTQSSPSAGTERERERAWPHCACDS